MNTLDEIIGAVLAQCVDADTKKVLSAFDKDKSRCANIKVISSVKYHKEHLEATSQILRDFTADHFPHAATFFKVPEAKYKSHIATDIVDVILSMAPTQCRVCKATYIATSAANTDSTISCLMCGRKSHTNCFNDYTIDNNAGVVFLCDPCLTKTETATVLENDAPTSIPSSQPPGSEAVVEEIKHDDDEDEAAPKDEICPLYRLGTCPHGLRGKKLIDGEPCQYRHPPRCHYFTGKYGTPGGCRLKDRCHFFHPPLCENSVKLKICLKNDCKDFHLPGTKRTLREPRQIDRREMRTNKENFTHRNPWEPLMLSASQEQAPMNEPARPDQNADFLALLKEIKAGLADTVRSIVREETRATSNPERNLPQANSTNQSIQPQPIQANQTQQYQPIISANQTQQYQPAPASMNQHNQIPANNQIYYAMYQPVKKQ